MIPTRHRQPGTDHAWRILENVREWTKHAEAKAATTLAAAAALGGVLYTLVTGTDDRSAWFDAAAASCALCVLGSGLTAGMALWPRPRLRGSSEPDSPLHYDHIARRHKGSSADYRARLTDLLQDEEALVSAIADQAWANAQVAHHKYSWVSRSVALLLTSLATLAVAATLSAARI
ncbi:Pycsar system effector family protein [Streptomyces adustus]